MSAPAHHYVQSDVDLASVMLCEAIGLATQADPAVRDALIAVLVASTANAIAYLATSDLDRAVRARLAADKLPELVAHAREQFAASRGTPQ